MPNRYAKRGRRLRKRQTNKRPFSGTVGAYGGAVQGLINAGKFGFKAAKIAKIVSHKGTGTQTQNNFNKKGKGVKVGSGQWACTAKRGRYRKAPKSITDDEELLNYQLQSTERLVNGAGRQGVGGIAANLWTLNDLGSALNYTFSGIANAKHAYVKSASLRAFGTNTTNNNVKVLIYNIVAKTDMQDGFFPVQDWAQGFVGENSALSQREIYGETPYGSSAFCSRWTIWKTTSFYLAEGESFMHNTIINYNRKISLAKIYDLSGKTTPSANTGAIGGLTQALLIVLQPFPAHETTTRTNISIPVAGLDICYSKRYASYNMSQNTRQIAQPTVFSTTFATAAQQMNEDTGVMTTLVS